MRCTAHADDSKEDSMETTKRRMPTGTLVLAAVLTALVIILQFMGTFIRFGPFAISLVLIPIVIGAATCGVKVGVWLGFVFGVVVLLSGSYFMPAYTLHPILIGLLSGLGTKLPCPFILWPAMVAFSTIVICWIILRIPYADRAFKL